MDPAVEDCNREKAAPKGHTSEGDFLVQSGLSTAFLFKVIRLNHVNDDASNLSVQAVVLHVATQGLVVLAEVEGRGPSIRRIHSSLPAGERLGACQAVVHFVATGSHRYAPFLAAAQTAWNSQIATWSENIATDAYFSPPLP